ncbi:hypothetical protein AQJ43_14055 [Streptomyces avermitilis]|nr:hypothetical protein AQJ43_14055 [Streptomyces avermitilis]OOV28079.1 hypothetical protein SM007_18975 [Streptomyces avermitilis]
MIEPGRCRTRHRPGGAGDHPVGDGGSPCSSEAESLREAENSREVLLLPAGSSGTFVPSARSAPDSGGHVIPRTAAGSRTGVWTAAFGAG